MFGALVRQVSGILYSLRPRYSRLQALGAHQASLPVQRRSASASVLHLTGPQLLHAAKLAKLSGACYLPDDELQDFLNGHNLRLHAAGNTHFTRYDCGFYMGQWSSKCQNIVDSRQQKGLSYIFHFPCIPVKGPPALQDAIMIA